MVGYLAGGGVDITARQLAEPRAGPGQTVLVENRAVPPACWLLAPGGCGRLTATPCCSARARSPPTRISTNEDAPPTPLRDLPRHQRGDDSQRAGVVNADVPAANVWLSDRMRRRVPASSPSLRHRHPLHLSGELFNRMARLPTSSTCPTRRRPADRRRGVTHLP